MKKDIKNKHKVSGKSRGGRNYIKKRPDNVRICISCLSYQEHTKPFITINELPKYDLHNLVADCILCGTRKILRTQEKSKMNSNQ